MLLHETTGLWFAYQNVPERSKSSAFSVRFKKIKENKLTKRVGIEDLSNIVRVRRLTLAEHIYCGDHQTDQQVWLCSGYLMGTGEEEDVQEIPGDKHSGKIYRRCESAGVVLAEWPVMLT